MDCITVFLYIVNAHNKDTYVYAYIITILYIVNAHIILIRILSSTDRLFRSITTLQCGKTHRTLEAGIKTRPTLH